MWFHLALWGIVLDEVVVGEVVAVISITAGAADAVAFSFTLVASSGDVVVGTVNGTVNVDLILIFNFILKMSSQVFA